MNDHRKNLLVTLADRAYLSAAQQLFASAHLHGGWDGDYMLLTPEDVDDSELAWFYRQGVVVKKLPIPVHYAGATGFPLTIYLMLHLFTPMVAAWDQVVFIDADCIVRASLAELSHVPSFSAIRDVLKMKLADQFRWYFVQVSSASLYQLSPVSHLEYKNTYSRLKHEYPLRSPSFNLGVLAFPTSIITDELLSNLHRIYQTYGAIGAFAIQGDLNLLFAERWHHLPPAYNAFAYYWMSHYGLSRERVDGVLLHFAGGPKPWETSNPFYPEWKENFDASENIDLQIFRPATRIWNTEELEEHQLFMDTKHFEYTVWFTIDRSLGNLGKAVRWCSPRLYDFIKRLIVG